MLNDASSDWWKTAVVYQIWPYSFKGTTDSGFGSLAGMTEKLPTIKSLGVDAIWVSPIFSSPGQDKGYDVSDYKDINPLFGTIADAETFVSTAHQNGMRVLFDMVVNHTSAEHEWFKSARASTDSPYRDYYIFRKGRPDGGPPNDWQSVFSGTAWTYNPATDDYYLHCFDSSQPDLNWKNPQLRAEMYDAIRFWMKRGVDGWRVDVICCMNKNPVVYEEYIPDGGLPWVMDDNLHERIREMCGVMREREGAIILGEVGDSADNLWKYTAPERGELTAAILFDMMWSDYDLTRDINKFAITGFNMKKIKAGLANWNSRPDNIVATHISSHDQPRIVSRWGNDKDERLRVLSAKMLGLFNHMMRGVPIVYQGEEIGMTNWDFTLDQVDDISVKNSYKKYVDDMQMFTKERFMELVHYFSRDNARTPVQWDASDNAGFSSVQPWMPINSNRRTINFEDAKADPNSIFHFYANLIALRKSEDLVATGDYDLAISCSDNVLGYSRSKDNRCLLVVCNFFNSTERIALKDIKFNFAQLFGLLLSNYECLDIESDSLVLRPYEAFVIKGSY